MSQQSIEIEVQPRTTGKHYSRTMRSQRIIPGVVYGPKTENLSLAIEEKYLQKFRGRGYENTIFVLKSSHDKLNGLPVLMKDVTVHPGSQRPTHVDFYAPDMSRDVRVDVEIQLTGKAKGIADGGFVQQILRQITVECSPRAIPESIVVDISELALNSSLHISDVKLPDGVKAVTGGDKTLVTCTVAIEEEAAPAAVAAPGTATAATAAPAATPAPAKK